MFSRFLLAIAMLLSSMGVASDAVGADEIEARLPDEMQFRRDFGLNQDVTAVRALMADPSAYDEEFPVALTDAERAEMRRRIAMQEDMGSLETFAAKLPGFAGHWIDQPGGGIIKVALVGATDEEVSGIQALAPRGASVEVVPAERTLRELEGVADALLSEAGGFQERGHRIGLWYIDEATNRVRVGVSSDVDAASRALKERFGDAVAIEFADPVTTACNSRSDCLGPPLRGGLLAPSNSSFPCSLAFLVKTPYVSNYTVGWLTAGHCAPSVGAVWQHDGVSIGTIRVTCWPGCQYSDAARAGELNSTYKSNRVYYSGSPKYRYVTGSQALNADDEGDYVCLNARRAENWRCGYIQDTSAYACYEYYYQGGPCKIWFNELRLASFANKKGDSGGAVHGGYTGVGVVAMGVESGCTYMPSGSDTCAGYGIYSHIARVLAELGGNWKVCSSMTPCE